LPHPVLVLGDDDRVLYANLAAETFFSLSHGMLKRQTLPDIIAFSSPLGALVGQVRKSGATVNEYGVEVDLPRSGVHRLVDVFRRRHIRAAGPHRADAAAALDGADDRAPADPSRGRPLGVGHGGGARPRDQEPSLGIRGAAQLLEPGLRDDDPRVDAAHLH
jgi:two-component system nitrogen regulation sensor histidine kinase GlnL